MKQGISRAVKFNLCGRVEINILPETMQFPGSQNFLTPPTNGGKWPARLHWVSAFLLAVGFLSTLAAMVLQMNALWLEAVLLLLAILSTLAALARQLPLQSVLLAAGIIALIGGLVQAIGEKSGIPFGPFIYGAETGWRIFDTLPWAVPLLWVVLVLNSRGVARLVLRPWRKMRTYGFWLIGLTALFTMLFDCALEPFAARTRHYWIWTSTGYSLTPQGAPITNSVGWFAVTLLILAFATPALINKQLSKRSSPSFHPLLVWLGGVALFATGSAMNGLWAAAIVDGIIAMLVSVFAIRGSRW